MRILVCFIYLLLISCSDNPVFYSVAEGTADVDSITVTTEDQRENPVWDAGPVQLVVTGESSDGSAVDVTGSAEYSSLTPFVATVDDDGTVTPSRAGDYKIKVDQGGNETTYSATFYDSNLVSIKVLRQAVGLAAGGCVIVSTGSCGLVKGSTIDPIILGNFENSDVSKMLKRSPYVTITSSNASIVSVDTSEKHKGRLTALKAGEYSITVSYQDPNDTESDPVEVVSDTYSVIESTLNELMLIGGGGVYKDSTETMKPIAIYSSRAVSEPTLEDGLCLTVFSADSCTDTDGDGFDDNAFIGVASLNGVNNSKTRSKYLQYDLSFDTKTNLYKFKGFKLASVAFKLFLGSSTKFAAVRYTVESNNLACIGYLNADESLPNSCTKDFLSYDSHTCRLVTDCNSLFSDSYEAPLGTVGPITMYKAVAKGPTSYTVSRITGRTYVSSDPRINSNISVKPLSKRLVAKKVNAAETYSILTLKYLDKFYSKSIKVVDTTPSSSLTIRGLDSELAPASYCSSLTPSFYAECTSYLSLRKTEGYFESSSPQSLRILNLPSGKALAVALEAENTISIQATDYTSAKTTTDTVDVVNK